jgi:uncharacterized lipoprotein YehR (DUF1307 family)
MKKLSILFAAFAVVMLASCGKYEDGPGFSLRSKTSRLAGTWTLTEVFKVLLISQLALHTEEPLKRFSIKMAFTQTLMTTSLLLGR